MTEEQTLKRFEDLVYKIAHRYENCCGIYCDFDDVANAGRIGLVLAHRNYNPEHYDTKFITFAHVCIENYMRNYLKSVHALKFPKKTDVCRTRSPHAHVSIQEIDPKGEWLKHRSSDFDYNLFFDQLIAPLNDREQTVLREILIHDRSLTDIAKMVGVSKQAIGQTRVVAISKVREAFYADEKRAGF